jgi:feruloyl esterase
VTDRKEPMRLDFWRYWVFNDPKWDWQTFDYDRDVARADEKLAAVNASSSDLSAFKRRGGKILMYSGWADPVGPPLDAVNFYQHVEQFIGSREKTESFFRLFMVPGMAHCGGGPGPNFFGGYGPPAPLSSQIKNDAEHDILNAVVEWVEKGVAPDYLIAAHLTDGHIDRTRPICPYPKVARWNGSLMTPRTSHVWKERDHCQVAQRKRNTDDLIHLSLHRAAPQDEPALKCTLVFIREPQKPMML